MIARRGAILLLLVFATALAPAAPAAADFGPIQLVSKGDAQPADKAEAPAISADGRYLAFQGGIGGVEAIFERNLETGALAKVAPAGAYDPEISNLRAIAPSISADGRYISFTTKAPLDPENDAGSTPDVYVADMAHSPPTYELVSARDGCDPGAETGCGLSYAGSGGSEASGRVALSADGRRVVFVTTAKSNLGGTAEDTPAGQVVLRDLAADTTTLVSVERDPESGQVTGEPVQGGAVLLGPSLPRLRGAALSADGTTVAWLGAHLPAQVALSPAEEKAFDDLDGGQKPYDEPLWRRVADGPSAPTLRVVGGADGPFPFPGLTGKNTDLNAAQGWLGVDVNGVPRLSADGRTVATIGNPTEATNLFLVEMAPGLSRAGAVRQLTREIVVDPSNPNGTINASQYVALNGHIFDLALSADGQRIAFATARQRFPLAPPNLIGSPPSSVGLVELYLIDLRSEAIERATHGVGGVDEASINPVLIDNLTAPKGDGAGAPSFGAGGLIAFSSNASNLVANDSNEASDVFLVEALEKPMVASTATISPAPAPLRRRHPWRLTLRAFSLPDGDVKLVAGVPAAGRLRTKVGSEPDDEVHARRLVGDRARASKAGRVAIELELPSRLGRLAHTREGVYGIARVSFRHRGRRVLHGRIQVRFHIHRREEGGR
jgi:WD40-like Beta Propeller Repeat